MDNQTVGKRRLPNFIIIAGLSGSGMSSATNAFEDVGYFCVDNLPVTMLSSFAKFVLPNEENIVAIEKAAVVISIRERHFFEDLPVQLEMCNALELQPFIIFFEASDSVLQRRFSETRRPHPADDGSGLANAIAFEREALKHVTKMADLVIDTSEHTVHTLRRLILQKFSQLESGSPLNVQIVSFGHKYGVPREVDMLFDVRHLPNPFFERHLSSLPGTDSRVVEFLLKQKDVNETIERFTELMKYLLPFYKREGKSYLTLGVGCTGGKHRSVMVADAIGRALSGSDFEISVAHRDVNK